MALPRRLVEGVGVMASLAQRLTEGGAEASLSIVAAIHSVEASKSSNTRSSSEMQRAWAQARSWRAASVLAAVRAGHDGGSTMPSEVKMMSRQGILLLRVLVSVDGGSGRNGKGKVGTCLGVAGDSRLRACRGDPSLTSHFTTRSTHSESDRSSRPRLSMRKKYRFQVTSFH